MEFFIDLWEALPGLTQIFVAMTALLGIYLSLFGYSRGVVNYGPTALVSIGIFGTFLGIAIGLNAFDTKDIQGSIPGLIAGLKTSFWSSITGLLFALVIKLRHLFGLIASSKSGSKLVGATVGDLAEQMKQLNQSISGGDDGSLLSQLKLARQDSNDRLDNVGSSLEKFLEEMAEANSEALIKALEEVIRDFNAKINEQFGENFKQLNAAVEKILHWQETYRLQMQEMIEQQKVTVENMKSATGDYAKLINDSEKFSETARNLELTIASLDSQRKSIEENIKNLSAALQTSKDSLPKIENKILELAEQLSRSVKDANDQTIAALTSVNNEMSGHIKDISETSKKQIAELDEALEEELSKALEMFGRQLSSLSEKFATDYTPLTERLREVLSIAQSSR